jgi:hypothetical protein
MAEQVLEKQDCRSCGVDIRRGALFCYNCGTSVAPDLDFQAINSKPDAGNGGVQKSAVEKIVEKPIEKPESLPFEKSSPIAANEKTAVGSKKLNSAASLRQRNRTPSGKKVEIVWEEPGEGTHVWFVITAVALTVFAIVILLAMLYIR